eukprot:jgi/Mesen1/6003/ME000306S05268
MYRMAQESDSGDTIKEENDSASIADPSTAEAHSHSKPPGAKRLLLTLSVLVGLLLGVPVWWVATSIHRAPLAYADIELLDQQLKGSPLTLPQHYHIVVACANSHEQDEKDCHGFRDQWKLEVEKAIDSRVGGREERLNARISVSVACDTAREGRGSSECTHGESCRADLTGEEQAQVGEGDARPGREDAAAAAVEEEQQLQQQQHWTDGLVDAGFSDILRTRGDREVDRWLQSRSSYGSPAHAGFAGTCSSAGAQARETCWEGEGMAAAGRGGSTGGRYTIIIGSTVNRGSGGGGREGGEGTGVSDAQDERQGEEEEEAKDEPVAVIGQFRHAWIRAESLATAYLQTSVAPLVAEVVVAHFHRGGGGGGSLGTRSAEEEEEGMPLGADGAAILSFSLLNAQPQEDWLFDWKFAALEARFLRLLVAALAPVARLSVESQVLYYTPMGAKASWHAASQSFQVAPADWPYVVNSKEWHLDTSTAATGRSKVLHFAVYLPGRAECPLLLRLPGGQASPTNAFTSPFWGGVLLFNPPACSPHAKNASRSSRSNPSNNLKQEGQRESRSKEKESETSGPPGGGTGKAKGVVNGGARTGAAEEGGPAYKGKGKAVGGASDRKAGSTVLGVEDLGPLMGVVVAQLRVLLGLPEAPVPSDRWGNRRWTLRHVAASEVGVAQWEVDVLVRRRAADDASSAASTLSALSKLVQSLPNMVIRDEIGAQVKSALLSTAAALQAAQQGDYVQCAREGHRARAFAEEAFFDPSVMALLYFPAEHHLAVYTPLFVPVILHTVVAFTKEFLRYIWKYREYQRNGKSHLVAG